MIRGKENVNSIDLLSCYFFITNVYGFVKIVEGGYERCLPFIENVAILINIDLQNDIHHKYKLLFAVCKLYSRDLF